MVSAVEGEPLRVEPMGIFAPRRSRAPTATPELLRSMVDGLDVDLRGSVANYLRRGTLVIALMEYTRDVLDDRFGVTGGSSLLSDGTFYWRRDAANYVEEYGITVPEHALKHMRTHQWEPNVLDEHTKSRIDQYLWEELRARGADGAPVSSVQTFYPSSWKDVPPAD